MSGDVDPSVARPFLETVLVDGGGSRPPDQTGGRPLLDSPWSWNALAQRRGHRLAARCPSPSASTGRALAVDCPSTRSRSWARAAAARSSSCARPSLHPCQRAVLDAGQRHPARDPVDDRLPSDDLPDFVPLIRTRGVAPGSFTAVPRFLPEGTRDECDRPSACALLPPMEVVCLLLDCESAGRARRRARDRQIVAAATRIADAFATVTAFLRRGGPVGTRRVTEAAELPALLAGL